MAKREIFADDLTNREIEESRFIATVTLTLTPTDEKGEPVTESAEEFAAEWDAAGNTANALRALVEDSDLVTFILKTRSQVSLAADPELVRKWAMDQTTDDKGTKRFPNLRERGRVPADITAAYRREVTTKANAADSAK